MAVTLNVYDVTNTTLQGTLSKAYEIGWLSDLRTPGALTFSVDEAASADRALLAPLRVVRVNVDGTDREAFIVQDRPSEIVTEDERPVVQYQCRHLLSRLGYGTAGAVLYPYGGIGGLEQNPRWFGPMGFDWDDPGGIPEPTTGGALTREHWQDPRAERFTFTNRGLFRRFLTGDGLGVRPARMWFTSAAWTEVTVWFDGAEVPALSTPKGDRSIRMWDIPYDGEDHVIFFDCKGDAPSGLQHSLGWTWALLEADDVGEFNDWGTMEGRLFTTFNSTTYSGPVAPSVPYWQAWEDYADGEYPGVSVGFVAATAIDEAQARGQLAGLTYDFDADLDSEGQAWTYELVHGFRMQRLGHLLDALAPWLCEPEMTPANVLRIHQQRGTDRTATVTITAPFSLSATGRGPVATRYLTETEGGFGSVVDTAAETAWGVQLEDYVSLGEDVHPHTAEEAVLMQLDEDAAIRNDMEVALPDSLEPYADVFVGDTVKCASDVDGTLANVRVSSLRGEVRDDTGRVEWFATLEPA